MGDAFALHQVQVYEPLPGGGSQVRITGTDPYLRFQYGQENDKTGRIKTFAPLYVKRGVISGADGTPIEEKDLPPWFWDEARKSSPEMRRAVKLVLPEERGKKGVGEDAKPSRTPVTTPSLTLKKAPAGLWKCPESDCGEVVGLQRKGVHIAKHRRDAKAARKATEAGRV